MKWNGRAIFASLTMLSIAAIATFAVANAKEDSEPNYSRIIDTIGAQLIKEGAAPGFSIAIAQGSDIVYAQGFGLADIQNKVAAESNTIYRIGSLTKQFTAAAIMQLVEQNKMRLDDPLTKYFPNYPTPGDQVTIRQLLHHTAGMKSFTSLSSYQELLEYSVTHESMVARFINEPFDFPPGERHLYNNSGYYLLGVIIEKVSGQSYAEYLTEHIIAPAGLLDTRYGADTFSTTRHAHGYTQKEKDFEPDAFLSMTQPFAAGALESTVKDLMYWQFELRSGKIVSPDSYSLMTTPGRLNSGTQFNYGLGLFIGRSNRRNVVFHTGGVNGFRCTLNYYVDEDVTIAVLTNSINANPTEFTKRIERAIFK